MKRIVTATAGLAALAGAVGLAASARAALPVGSTAPDFQLQASLAGKPMPFSLAQALKKGPVVLYFFPAAFTSGCTKEAHDFAEATPEFARLGATVLGVTAGNIERVAEFSSAECRDKFPVAGDPGLKVAGAYKSTLMLRPGWSDRTSYVIAPDHKIVLAYSALNPDEHVARTLAAVKALKGAK